MKHNTFKYKQISYSYFSHFTISKKYQVKFLFILPDKSVLLSENIFGVQFN